MFVIINEYSLIITTEEYSLIIIIINNQRFSNKIQAVQYNAALAITNAIKGTFRTKLYKELGIEPLTFRRWFRRFLYFL